MPGPTSHHIPWVRLPRACKTNPATSSSVLSRSATAVVTNICPMDTSVSKALWLGTTEARLSLEHHLMQIKGSRKIAASSICVLLLGLRLLLEQLFRCCPSHPEPVSSIGPYFTWPQEETGQVFLFPTTSRGQAPHCPGKLPAAA